MHRSEQCCIEYFRWKRGEIHEYFRVFAGQPNHVADSIVGFSRTISHRRIKRKRTVLSPWQSGQRNWHRQQYNCARLSLHQLRHASLRLILCISGLSALPDVAFCVRQSSLRLLRLHQLFSFGEHPLHRLVKRLNQKPVKQGHMSAQRHGSSIKIHQIPVVISTALA